MFCLKIVLDKYISSFSLLSTFTEIEKEAKRRFKGFNLITMFITYQSTK